MSIPQRIDEIVTHSDSCVWFVLGQTGKDKEVYKGNSKFMGSRKYSRNQIIKVIFDYLENFRIEYEGQDFTYMGEKLERSDDDVLFDNGILISNIIENCVAVDRLKPFVVSGQEKFAVSIVNRRMKDFVDHQLLMSETTRDENILRFLNKNLPKSFGGDSEVKPYDFIIGFEKFKDDLRKLNTTKGTFKLPICDIDTSCHPISAVLRSNFIEGGRLLSEASGQIDEDKFVLNRLRRNLIKLIDDPSTIARRGFSSIFDDDFHIAERIDITNLVTNYSTNELRSECIRLLFKYNEKAKHVLIIGKDFKPAKLNGYYNYSETFHYISSDSAGHPDCSRVAEKINGKWEAYLTSYSGIWIEPDQWMDDCNRIDFTSFRSPKLVIDLIEKYDTIVISKKINLNGKIVDHLISPLCTNKDMRVVQYALTMKRGMLLYDDDDMDDFAEVEDTFDYVRPVVTEYNYVEDEESEEKEERSFSEIESDGMSSIDFDLNDLEPIAVEVLSEPDAEETIDEKIEISRSETGYSESQKDWIIKKQTDFGIEMDPPKMVRGERIRNCRFRFPFRLRESYVTNPDVTISIYKRMRSDILDQGGEDVDFNLNMLRVVFKRFMNR